MSKAFVSEEVIAAAAQPVREPPRIAPGEKRYITADGFERLQRELAEVEAQLPGARAAPEHRRQLEERARLLTATLSVVTVVPRPETAPERAFLGAWVELEDEDGERVRYRLVGPDEVDVKAGLISVESPLGRAMLGRATGDEVRVQTPRGAREYVVVAVR